MKSTAQLFYETPKATIYKGHVVDCLKILPDKSVHMVVTSPPYWGLRSYLPANHPLKHLELGAEKTPEQYVKNLCDVFDEVWRVLRDDGTLWLNLGDSWIGGGRAGEDGKSYGSGLDGNRMDSGNVWGKPTGKIPGYKKKDLAGIPWQVAFELRKRGWYLRQDIIWHKPNPMPSSVTDRCTSSHEYLFLLSKKPMYFFDNEAIREPIKASSGVNMRAPKNGSHRLTDGYSKVTSVKEYSRINGANRRSVWSINTVAYTRKHFATFSPELALRCVLAGSPVGGTVLDPFGGSGTTAQVATEKGRRAITIDLDSKSCLFTLERLGLYTKYKMSQMRKGK